MSIYILRMPEANPGRLPQDMLATRRGAVDIYTRDGVLRQNSTVEIMEGGVEP